MATTMKATMKSVRIHSFGGPDVLQFEDAPVPKAGKNEMFVRVYAAGVNPVDWKIRQRLLGQGPLPQRVIDYRSTKFEDVVHDVDVVLDTIGGDTQERSWNVLKRGGILVSIVQPPAQEKAASHSVRGVFLISKARGDQLARIADLVVSGQVKVIVEKKLPLREARQAQELSQSGHAHGKIVLVTDAHGD